MTPREAVVHCKNGAKYGLNHTPGAIKQLLTMYGTYHNILRFDLAFTLPV
jgi:hypothetical protein